MARCQRCYKPTIATIMSMYSTELICMKCKDAEKKRPDYKQAEAADLNAYAGRLDGLGMTGSANSVRDAAAKLVEGSDADD